MRAVRLANIVPMDRPSTLERWRALVRSGSHSAARRSRQRGLRLLFSLLLRVGVRADYRRNFWRLARHAYERGELQTLLGVGLVSYHLIEFTREALSWDQNASFYSARAREDLASAAPRP